MNSKFQIESIKPNGYDYHSNYTFEKYKAKADYNWRKEEKIFIDKITKVEEYKNIIKKIIFVKIEYFTESMIEIQPYVEGLSNPKNKFLRPSIGKSYFYISIFLNVNYFLKNKKSHEFFEILAILNIEKPFVEFEYYKIGEKYGIEEYTIVKYDNKIIKFFYCILNNKRYTIEGYFKEYKLNKSESEIASIVEEYLDELNFELEMYYDKKNEEQDNLDKSYLNEKHSLEDSYYEGGGGDEWSDPDDFWG